MTALALQPGSRESHSTRVEQLEAENEELRDRLAFYELTIFGDILQFPSEWRLTCLENRVLGVLLSLNIAHPDAIMTALYRGNVDEEPERKIVDVMICKLRRKLRPFGVEIRTMHQVGFYIEKPRRNQIRTALKLIGPPSKERDRALASVLESHRVPERTTSLHETRL